MSKHIFVRYDRKMTNRFITKLCGLADLSARDIDRLRSITANPRPFAARQNLIREGDAPGPMFIMMDGWACRYKILPDGARQIVAFMMPGDACDLHIRLLAEMDHSIQAITTALVAIVSRDEMQSMLREHPAIANAMYAAQLIDEGIMRAWIISMGRRNSLERVAHLGCELYLRARNIGLTDAVEFDLPLSQVVLSDALGMTPVHINRILKELRIAGVMSLKRGSVTITDPLKLTQIAGFDENFLYRRLRKAS